MPSQKGDRGAESEGRQRCRVRWETGVLGQKGDIGVTGLTSQNGDRGCRVRREVGVPSQRR